jgi:hypothetical protein
MPKVSKLTRAAKRASKKSTATTKTIAFTFEGNQYTAEISRKDKPATIYGSILAVLAEISSEVPDINITDQHGVKLQLEYGRLKNNIHVHRASEQHVATDRGIKKNPELLAKILRNWGLASAQDIFPLECAPCAPNLAGVHASFYDQHRTISLPQNWSCRFVTALYKLSTLSVAKHNDALFAMMTAATARHKDEGNALQTAREITRPDVEAAIEDMGARLGGVAGEAIEALDTEVFAGGLKEGIQEVAREMETSVVPAAEERQEPRSFELAFR